MNAPFYPGETAFWSVSAANTSGGSASVSSPPHAVYKNLVYDSTATGAITLALATGGSNPSWMANVWLCQLVIPSTYLLGDSVMIFADPTVGSQQLAPALVWAQRLGTTIRPGQGIVSSSTATGCVLTGMFPQGANYNGLRVAFDDKNAAGFAGSLISNAVASGSPTTINGITYLPTLTLTYVTTGVAVTVGIPAVIGGSRTS